MASEVSSQNDGIDRRGFLECMAWAGSGLVWTLNGGLAGAQSFGQDRKKAGPNDFSASSVLLAAPNNLAPTGLAQRIRVPSFDHSQAGNALVACTASRGSLSPCNWNSALFIRAT